MHYKNDVNSYLSNLQNIVKCAAEKHNTSILNRVHDCIKGAVIKIMFGSHPQIDNHIPGH